MSLLTRHAKPFSSDTVRQKELVKEKAQVYRQKVDAQWQELQTDARHYGKQALVIGGVFAGVYVVMNALLPSDEEEQIDEVKDQVRFVAPERKSSSVGKALGGLAISFAIGWARQKLSHYVEAEKKTDA